MVLTSLFLTDVALKDNPDDMVATDIDLKNTKYCYKPLLIRSKFTSFLEGGLFNTPFYEMTHSCVSFAYTMIEMANPQPGNRQH